MIRGQPLVVELRHQQMLFDLMQAHTFRAEAVLIDQAPKHHAAMHVAHRTCWQCWLLPTVSSLASVTHA
eukprot:15436269-Alexandrium_andersonii.AAC.1